MLGRWVGAEFNFLGVECRCLDDVVCAKCNDYEKTEEKYESAEGHTQCAGRIAYILRFFGYLLSGCMRSFYNGGCNRIDEHEFDFKCFCVDDWDRGFAT